MADRLPADQEGIGRAGPSGEEVKKRLTNLFEAFKNIIIIPMRCLPFEVSGHMGPPGIRAGVFIGDERGVDRNCRMSAALETASTGHVAHRLVSITRPQKSPASGRIAGALGVDRVPPAAARNGSRGMEERYPETVVGPALDVAGPRTPGG